MERSRSLASGMDRDQQYKVRSGGTGSSPPRLPRTPITDVILIAWRRESKKKFRGSVLQRSYQRGFPVGPSAARISSRDRTSAPWRWAPAAPSPGARPLHARGEAPPPREFALSASRGAVPRQY